MVLETGIVVAGTGYAGSAIARHLTDPKNNAPFTLIDKTHGEMLVDVILSEHGVVAGVLLARAGDEALARPQCACLAAKASGDARWPLPSVNGS
ncbi:MAG TPA: hypothetical protein VFH78_11290, partial [Candidatus Thermoplasmatota archaeon]|nr:hypothetical protein [Candidatus Thermoplasmatota archaeon]